MAPPRIIQMRPGDSDSWSPWEEFGGHFKEGLALAQSGDGRLEIFAVTADDSMLMHRWEKYADDSDQWAQWATLGRTVKPYPAVRDNEQGNLEVFTYPISFDGLAG